jgi:hypothetical protein
LVLLALVAKVENLTEARARTTPEQPQQPKPEIELKRFEAARVLCCGGKGRVHDQIAIGVIKIEDCRNIKYEPRGEKNKSFEVEKRMRRTMI